MAINLIDNAEQYGIEATEFTRKLTIAGVTKAYKVYRIPLELLFYNDQNDRIATWISKYRAEHDGTSLDITAPDYNDIIQDFIVKSNPEAIQETQANIEKFNQREAGVVLRDGRIIDGNRRFTCLRNLAKKASRFAYFEAVILPKDMATNAKQIKMLELSIQHGEESKVEYNPIDRLVGIYQDIERNHLLSIQEYAESTNTTTAKVKQQLEIAKLMVEFLEFIGAPEKFYIARELDLNGPLVELYGILKSITNGEEKEQMKQSIFINLLMSPTGDMTRFIRKAKTINKSKARASFLAKQQEIAEAVLEKIEDHAAEGRPIDLTYINTELHADNELRHELARSVESSFTHATNEAVSNQPEQLIDRAIGAVQDIDIGTFAKLSAAQRESFQAKLSELKNVIEEMERNLGV